MPVLNTEFVDEVTSSQSFNAAACMNCGVCTAVCPMGLDLLPRRLFRYAVIGVEEKILEHQETIFSCLMCRMCEQNCPVGVKISENVRVLRGYINRTVFGLSRK
jgi:heterodisulfide reductase subunit C